MSYEDVIKSGSAVLVEFYATWCPHCQRMVPVVNDVEKRLDGRVPVYRFDIDKYETESDASGVDVVPTFILYRDGKEVWRHSGEISADDLMGKVTSFV